MSECNLLHISLSFLSKMSQERRLTFNAVVALVQQKEQVSDELAEDWDLCWHSPVRDVSFGVSPNNASEMSMHLALEV